MKLTTDLIQEIRRLSALHNEPLLAEAAERLELCNKSHNTIIRLLSRANEELEAVKSERDRMLEDMHGVCMMCAYRDGSHCDMNVIDTGGDCAFWMWRGYK